MNNNFVNIINNLNNCDTDELVSFETVVDNYDSNVTNTILLSNEHVVTPDNAESLEVEVVMPVSVTNIITLNLIFLMMNKVWKWKFLGKKRERKMIVNLIN